MASHHHSCHPPTPYTPTPIPTQTYQCHCCYSAYTACLHHPPPTPPDSHTHYHHPPPQPHLYSAQTDLNLHQHHPRFGERYILEERQAQPSVSSLLRRISALESALLSRSSSSSPHSLRDAAARTIQTHFRAFLVRRSRTLRQLKDLASIKSALTVLKSSVSGRTHFDYEVVYHKAVNLLLTLDAIQGGDPMIRDGKNSIIRELDKFLDLIDSIPLERRELSGGVNGRYRRNNVKTRAFSTSRKIDSTNGGMLKRVNVEKLRGLAERIDKLAEELDEEEGNGVTESPNACTIRKNGVSIIRSGGLVKPHGGIQPKVKKTVTFAENGKVYRVLRREPLVDEDCDDSIDRDDLDDAERELEEDVCREVEEIGVSSKDAEDEVHSEDGGSLPSSVDERDSGGYQRTDEGKTGNFVFSAPLPVKMEARDELIGQRKRVAK